MSFDINSELFALKTFERYNDEMKYIIDSTSSLYLKIVNLKTFDELSKMLKLLDLDTNSICAKKITNLGGWCCADCVRSDNSIYCQECWSQMKDKHKGHKIVFTKKVDNGTCDCGDHNYIDNKCNEICDKSSKYKYEYNEKCYADCEKGFLYDENNNQMNKCKCHLDKCLLCSPESLNKGRLCTKCNNDII